ncbi:MAG: hypothetical protein AAF541_12805 [Pseudomonadota bacterium]
MHSTVVTQNVLVLTVALGGYRLVFDKLIASHSRYAQRHGYQHALIDKAGKIHPHAAPWLKLSLAKEALLRNYDVVLVVDADCLIRQDTPAIATVWKQDKYVYGVKGFSGRLNSGFLVFKRCPEVLELLELTLDSCERPVDGQDWGENGHLIYFSHSYSELAYLPRCWNNNCDPSARDYVRHFCGGTAMARNVPISIWRRWLLLLLRRRIQRLARCEGLRSQISSRTLYCLARYPVFHQAQPART